MATKTLKARIKLKYDTYENWSAADNQFKLEAGEVAVTSVLNVVDPVNNPPTIMFKVGDGTKTYNQLGWASALAADVYAWGKAAKAPVADILSSGSNVHVTKNENNVYTIGVDEQSFVDTNTLYRIKLDGYTLTLESSEDGNAWTTQDTLTLPDNNTTYTFDSTATSGASFNVTPSGGNTQTVYIDGLGSAAFKSDTYFATAQSVTDIKGDVESCVSELDKKLNKATGKSVVYVNGGNGAPTTIGFAENTAPASSMVRRNTDGAVVATNLAAPFNDITKLGDNLGKRLIYVGGDKTINGGLSKITINSNIYDIDFNGATITLNFDERQLVANTYDGLLNGHSHCVIRNLNLKVVIKPFSTNTAVTGYNVLDTFGGIENSLITINSNEVTGGTVNITLRGIANADHINNTKVNFNCYTPKVTAVCYSYCNYLFWCRADKNNNYSFAECNYLVNCSSMTNSTTKVREKSASYLNCSALQNCSYYIVASDPNDSSHNPALYATLKYTSTVGKSPLDNIQEVNDGKTKAYVKPANGSGITAVIDVDTDANANTIVRRLTDGRVRGTIAKDANDLTTLSQVTSYTQGNPTENGTEDLTKIKIADVVYNIPQGQTIDAYTKDETNTLLNAKQNTLTQPQLNAANSGITANKVSIYDGYADAINNKVDKVTGKGLSTNDFTTAEKTKLVGIETGAEVNEIDTIAAGENVTVSKSGKTVTISATGGGGNSLKVTIW